MPAFDDGERQARCEVGTIFHEAPAQNMRQSGKA